VVTEPLPSYQQFLIVGFRGYELCPRCLATARLEHAYFLRYFGPLGRTPRFSLIILFLILIQSGRRGKWNYTIHGKIVMPQHTYTHTFTFLSIYLSIYLFIYPFIQGSKAFCWTLAFSVSWSFKQSVGLLGWRISQSQGRYLHIGQHKHRINAYRHPCFKWNSNPRSQCSSGRWQFMT
jgi:hypothetical protein